MHKAKVQVQSKVGKGTAFVITFPPYAPQSKVDPDGAHEAEVVEDVHPCRKMILWNRKERTGVNKKRQSCQPVSAWVLH